MTKRVRQGLGALLSIVLFAVAIAVLHHELSKFRYEDVRREIADLSFWQIAAALGLTLLSYLLLTEYDAIGFRYIRRPLAYPRIALASFIGYSFSHNIGVALLSGGSVRFRIYSAWGLSAIEITKVVFLNGITFALGYLCVGSIVVLADPPAIPASIVLPISSLRWTGLFAALVVVVYVVCCARLRKPFRIRGYEFVLPSLRLTLAQLVVGSVECALAGSVFYVLLPRGAPVSWSEVLGVYLIGQVVGILSHVPGGLGVFEGAMLAFISPKVAGAEVLGALLAFRAIYFLLPFGIAVVLLAGHELIDRVAGLRRFTMEVGQRIPGLVSNVVAFATFLGGAVLLLSGSRPPDRERLAAIAHVVPLSVIEFFHFLGSIVGIALLVLARGLQRRLEIAWQLASVLVGVGIACCLLKGLLIEEATVLAILFLALLTARPDFYRRASLLGERLTAWWIASIVVALVASASIGAFAFKHVAYSNEMWLRFALEGDASRFLRGMAGAIGAAAIVVAVTWMRRAPIGTAIPGPPDLERARSICRHSPIAQANLALLGDKSLLFSEEGDAFVMYAIEGRSWIALGDPLGPPHEAPELVWRFRELVDRHAGRSVFHEVPATSVHLYVDLGLTLVKLGEAARVRLDGFSSFSGTRDGLRRVSDRVCRDGYRFEVIPRAGVAASIAEFEAVSNAWLAERRMPERGFSVGNFAPRYLEEFPAAVVRRDGAVVAFANVLSSTEKDAEKEELSVDLARFLPSAPADVVEFLLVQLMLWGEANGYRWFDLGIAPTTEAENGELARLWSQVGAPVFRLGEPFLGMQGLRAYKQKFDPEWAPRYLAFPGGLTLTGVLADVTALINRSPGGLAAK
ncbi:MAG: bifunctional lysylphosphatidylglycerol flippase/synthetase MprF [Planctomycetes bacterium]|nr:bifunctional lysylphosphatidylglycerol flippase/synthetase MprF [Planctomycetota bacterium]